MKHSHLFRFGLFNTELTEIKNGWLVTERSISIFGVEYPITTYFKTLKKAMLHLAKREENAEKRKKEKKVVKFKARR